MRHFLAATAGALGAAALGDGFLLEPAAVQVTRHELPIPGLPAALDGVRIACLADVHLHRGISRAAHAALEHVDRERPEIVVLAGDICNKRGDLPTLTAWARDARGTLATFATFGNWERYAKIDRATAEAAYGKAGVEFLCNTTARVSIRGATLTILGLDDPVEGRPDPMAALAGVGARDVAVWVLHGPGYVDELPKGITPSPRGPHPRRADSLARHHTGPTGWERAVRRRLVPRHARSPVCVARHRDGVRSGAAVLPPRATRLQPPFVASPINTLTFRELEASLSVCRSFRALGEA